MKGLTELKKIKEKLEKQLDEAMEQHPLYKSLQAVQESIRLMSDMPLAEKKKSSFQGRLISAEEREKIVETAKQFFEENGNTSAPVKKIATYILSNGASIPGNRPGASVGAILRGNQKFIQDSDGFWSLFQPRTPSTYPSPLLGDGNDFE